jgi:hypothetical protein
VSYRNRSRLPCQACQAVGRHTIREVMVQERGGWWWHPTVLCSGCAEALSGFLRGTTPRASAPQDQLVQGSGGDSTTPPGRSSGSALREAGS